MPQYQIFFSNHKAEKDWHSLEAQMPDKMAELKRFLQYDITDSYRIWYQVDSSDKAVYVEYIGPHP